MKPIKIHMIPERWVVLVCNDPSGKPPHRQAGMDRVIASGSVDSLLIRTLAWGCV